MVMTRTGTRGLGVLGALAIGLTAVHVASCSGEVSTPPPAVAQTPTPTTSANSFDLSAPGVPGQVLPAVASGAAKFVRPVAPTLPIQITLALRLHSDDLHAFVRDVTDRHSPLYRKFLTFDEARARFSPSDQEIGEVEAWAAAAGLREAQRFATGHAITVEADVGTVNRAFGLLLNEYELGGHHFYANDRAPTVPTKIAPRISDILGLESGRQAHHVGSNAELVDLPAPRFRPGPPISVRSTRTAVTQGVRFRPQITGPLLQNGNPNTAFEPEDIWSPQGYNYAPLRTLAHCCNPLELAGGAPPATSIAFYEELNPLLSDVDTFFAEYSLTSDVTLTNMSGSGGSDLGVEAALDIEWTGAMANPQNTGTPAHEFAYANGPAIANTYVGWEQIDSDNLARTFSDSVDALESVIGSTTLQTFTTVAEDMVSKGWTLVAAAGDHGAFANGSSVSADYPAADPNFVSAGGTNLVQVTWPVPPGQTLGNFDYENPWNYSALGAGGGGCSQYFALPSWQETPYFSSSTTYCIGEAASYRMFPDVALNAGGGGSQANAQVVYLSALNPPWFASAGTSVVAPEVAGFAVLENSYVTYNDIQSGLCTVGNSSCADTTGGVSGLVSPRALWSFSNATGPVTPMNPYYDITSQSTCPGNTCTLGTNGLPNDGYDAHTGYDQATGWGSFNALQLAWAINYTSCMQSPSTVTFTGPSTGSTVYTTAPTVSFTIAPHFDWPEGWIWLAGYTAQWDSDPGSPSGFANQGSGQGTPFYTGPAVIGQLMGSSTVPSAGCHTLNVRIWSNAGASLDATYGPLCYSSCDAPYSIYDCDGQCCVTGDICSSGLCCASGTENCGGSCCAAADCISGVCCPANHVCNGTCLPACPGGAQCGFVSNSCNQSETCGGGCQSGYVCGGNGFQCVKNERCPPGYEFDAKLDECIPD
jgi:subtilase family serine protease